MSGFIRARNADPNLDHPPSLLGLPQNVQWSASGDSSVDLELVQVLDNATTLSLLLSLTERGPVIATDMLFSKFGAESREVGENRSILPLHKPLYTQIYHLSNYYLRPWQSLACTTTTLA